MPLEHEPRRLMIPSALPDTTTAGRERPPGAAAGLKSAAVPVGVGVGRGWSGSVAGRGPASGWERRARHPRRRRDSLAAVRPIFAWRPVSARLQATRSTCPGPAK